jgi:hypothetical protein
LRAEPRESLDLFWLVLLIFPGSHHFIYEIGVRVEFFPERLPTLVAGFRFVFGVRKDSAESDI